MLVRGIALTFGKLKSLVLLVFWKGSNPKIKDIAKVTYPLNENSKFFLSECESLPSIKRQISLGDSTFYQS